MLDLLSHAGILRLGLIDRDRGKVSLLGRYHRELIYQLMNGYNQQ